MSVGTLKNILAGIAFVLIQVLLFQHLSIFGATPDLLLIYLLWLALKYDRLHLVLIAAGLGLFQDALYDLWGLHMFSKTLLCFLIYRLISGYSEARLLLWQVFLSIIGAALIHNLIFLGLSSFIDAYTAAFNPIIFSLLGSLYTAVAGTILFVFKGR
ncbi:MAG: rod shape-determining protein MreD [Balneolaceae bacterium]|nr:rod shape-determining protein MreD [Balneolaceae bacterium]